MIMYFSGSRYHSQLSGVLSVPLVTKFWWKVYFYLFILNLFLVFGVGNGTEDLVCTRQVLCAILLALPVESLNGYMPNKTSKGWGYGTVV